MWSSLPTSDYLCDLGEALVGNEWRARENYSAVRSSENCWLCMACSPQEESEGANEGGDNICEDSDEKLSVLVDEIVDENNGEADAEKIGGFGVDPRFRRVRTITRCRITGVLTCSCCLFQRIGIPCRHIMKVLADELGPGYRGISHHDVLVFWHKSYYYFGMGDWTEMRDLLLKLSENDTTGPVLPQVSFFVADEKAEKQLIETTASLDLCARCLNYPESVCRAALRRRATAAAPPNLSLKPFLMTTPMITVTTMFLASPILAQSSRHPTTTS